MGEYSDEAISNTGCKRRCGYEYMTPSYVLDEELDEAASYPVIGNALLENSSAHGLPTLYRAQGDSRSAAGYYLTCDTSLFSSTTENLINKQSVQWKPTIDYVPPKNI